jgi:hypothetical protein
VNPGGKNVTDVSSANLGDRGQTPSLAAEDITEVLDFSSYDLRTTIRLIVLSGESRRVDVKRGSKKGSVHVAGGEILSAFSPGKEGDEAFFDILSWDGAAHTDVKELALPERNVTVPTGVLLDLFKKGGART